MVTHISPQQGIKDNVLELERRLGDLGSKMLAYPERLRVDAAYLIPFRDQAKVDTLKEVIVTPLEGSEAVHRAVYGLTSLRIEPGNQSPRETLRTPGVIALPTDWINELHELNMLREIIEGYAVQIKDRYERTKAWGGTQLQYISGLQVIRKTLIANRPKRVRFFWESAPSVQNKTGSEWIKYYTEYLKKLHGHFPNAQELEGNISSRKLVELIMALAEFQEEPIASLRPGQPHVRARVSFHNGDKFLLRPAPTPIVYGYDEQVPFITPLSNWTPSISGPKRETRDPLISDKRVLDGHQFFRYLANIDAPKPQ